MDRQSVLSAMPPSTAQGTENVSGAGAQLDDMTELQADACVAAGKRNSARIWRRMAERTGDRCLLRAAAKFEREADALDAKHGVVSVQ